MKVAVVGAGIVGASCAFYLSERGAEVVILERNDQPASGSTARSAAGLRHQFSHPENVRMSLFSAATYRRFIDHTGQEAGYRRVGYLFLVPQPERESWLRQAEMQRGLGAIVEPLEPEAAAERFPFLDLDGVAVASYGPDDGVVDPHGITLGFLGAARRRGARLRLGCAVSGLSRVASRWRIDTSCGTMEADAVVNAAGPQAARVAALAGLAIPVTPHRRNVYATAPFPGFPHPTPLIIDVATGVWLRSEGERFLFGLSNPAEPPGENLAVDWSWLPHSLDLALPRFPFLATAGLDRRACWAGLYAITPDHLPILGRPVGFEGFVNACGFSGHGVQHAPATGLIVAEELLDGAAHSFRLEEFRLERFAGATVRKETNIV